MILDGKCPTGPIEQTWDKHRFDLKLVNPANKRKYSIIVVGTGLAGGAAAASLGELGYNVQAFCYQDSPRRAHSIAAQGGINAAKNYPNDGDSIYRLFYDTIKGGDFRAREADVWRLAQVSNNIIDQCVAQGVPFARDYAGYLDNRSFGGAQVSRTFFARGQTGQQLLLGAYSALSRQIKLGSVKMYDRREMLDLVVVDGVARGITVRNLVTGAMESYAADAVCLATGRTGATTVAATMIAAHLAGIEVFATGGIGGVHRGAELSFDISADLRELSGTPVSVVSAGAKAILDIPKTLEVLETLGVPVIAVGQDEFPAFWSRSSGLPAPLRLDTPAAIAAAHLMRARLGLPGGQLIANPIPVEAEISRASITPIIEKALAEAKAEGIAAKSVTPFLLKRIFELSEGRSLAANIALVLNNARLAAEIATEISRQRCS